MALETWLDDVCAVFGEISNGRGGNVVSYNVFKRAEIPKALTDLPCAITYVPGMTPDTYTASALTAVTWDGITELHITSTADPALLPDVMRYFDRVVDAVTAHKNLAGKVSFFLLPETEKAIRMDVLQYGEGVPHYGLIVAWRVREQINQALT